MQAPDDPNELLRQLTAAFSNLTAAQEQELREMIALIRQGAKAVFVVEEHDAKLKYMFSQCSRAQAVERMGSVIEQVARQL